MSAVLAMVALAALALSWLNADEARNGQAPIAARLGSAAWAGGLGVFALFTATGCVLLLTGRA